MQEREFRVVAATPKAEGGEGRPRPNGDRGPRAGAAERPAGPSPAAGRLPVDLRRGEPPAESGARGRQLVDPGSSDRAADAADPARPDARSTWDSLGEPPAESQARGRRPVDPPGGPTETRESRRDPEVGLVCVWGVGPTPRSAGRPARRKEEEGRARDGTPGGWPPPGPARTPPGQGPAGRGSPRSARRPPPRFPTHAPRAPVPARGGRATPAVNGEEAGTGEAGRADRGRARPSPPPPPPAAGGRPGGRRKVDGRTDGRPAPEARAPPAGPRQTLVSRADFQ